VFRVHLVNGRLHKLPGWACFLRPAFHVHAHRVDLIAVVVCQSSFSARLRRSGAASCPVFLDIGQKAVVRLSAGAPLEFHFESSPPLEHRRHGFAVWNQRLLGPVY
jgi:hypothetical protein